MVAHFVNEETDDKKIVKLVYKGIEIEELQEKVASLMQTIGYTEKEPNVFEKGNRVLRILFGAFVKYFKFRINYDDVNENHVRLYLQKATSGFSGGAIGVAQVNNEFKKLKGTLKKI